MLETQQGEREGVSEACRERKGRVSAKKAPPIETGRQQAAPEGGHGHGQETRHGHEPRQDLSSTFTSPSARSQGPRQASRHAKSPQLPKALRRGKRAFKQRTSSVLLRLLPPGITMAPTPACYRARPTRDSTRSLSLRRRPLGRCRPTPAGCLRTPPLSPCACRGDSARVAAYDRRTSARLASAAKKASATTTQPAAGLRRTRTIWRGVVRTS